jgi:hypothetical protein
LYKLSCKKEIEMNMGWNEDAYEIMEHEMKGVSNTRYNMVKIKQVRYHNKCNRNQHKTKPKQCKI